MPSVQILVVVAIFQMRSLKSEGATISILSASTFNSTLNGITLAFTGDSTGNESVQWNYWLNSDADRRLALLDTCRRGDRNLQPNVTYQTFFDSVFYGICILAYNTDGYATDLEPFTKRTTASNLTNLQHHVVFQAALHTTHQLDYFFSYLYTKIIQARLNLFTPGGQIDTTDPFIRYEGCAFYKAGEEFYTNLEEDEKVAYLIFRDARNILMAIAAMWREVNYPIWYPECHAQLWKALVTSNWD